MQGRNDPEGAALCANWMYDTLCCPGVLQSRQGEDGAEWCCVGNNIPNAMYCGNHDDVYDPQTASCSATYTVGSEGYTSSVLSAALKFTVTKVVNPRTVTSNGLVSTTCDTVTAGVASGPAGATSLSTGIAQPAITAPALGLPVFAAGGLLLAL